MVTRTKFLEWMTEANGGVLPDRENPGIITGYVNFTKERAAMALGNNVQNRGVNLGQVNRLAQALQAGLWDPNVSKLNFDEDMVLSDGQHRLLAIVKSGQQARCQVTIGMKKTAQGLTDRRGNRSLSNDLEIAKISASKQVAALTRIHAVLADGVPIPQVIAKGHVLFDQVDALMMRYYYEHEKEIQWMKTMVNAADNQVRRLKINKSVLNVLAPKFGEVNEDDAIAFWERLGKGIINGADDPIRLLRLRLEASADDPHKKLNKLTTAALIIKAWNMYMAGLPCKNLRFRIGGASPEAFPEIYNPYR